MEGQTAFTACDEKNISLMFDYSKLRGKIREVFGTQENFAKALGISSATISDKLNNKTEWTQKEIDKAAKLISVAKEGIPEYFFAEKVQLTEQ